MNRIYLKEHGILPGSNVTLPLYELFRRYPEDTEFIFEKGNYYFSPVLEYDYRLSNTDGRPTRKLGIWMRNMKNVVLDGAGSRFLYAGHMQAVTLDHCENITLKDFSIDWEKPLVAEGVVTAFTENTVDLHVDGRAFPHRFSDGKLEFDVGNDEWYGLQGGSQIQFDEQTRTVRRDTGDRFCTYQIEQLAEDDFRLYYHGVRTAVGNTFVLRHNKRWHAGIFTEKCKNITVSDVAVYSCGGLGCLAQFCEDLTYRRVNFLPNREAGRTVSGGRDDGMHITCCKGTVTITECSFLGLMDDPINVHSCCVPAVSLVDDCTLLCRYGHPEAGGFLYWAEDGDEISFIHRRNMTSVGTGAAAEYKLLNGQEFLLKFREPLSEEIREMAAQSDLLAVDNLSHTASFICTKNRFGSCRARGILVSTPKPVKISRNYFASSGTAVLVAGDANGWFESGECHDVEISDNVFSDVCLSSLYQFCEGVISVCPVVPEPDTAKPFHKNIRILNNVFDTPDTPVLYAFSCDGLTFAGNRIFRSPSSEKWHSGTERIRLSHCRNAEISDNCWIGDFSLNGPAEESCENVVFGDL